MAIKGELFVLDGYLGCVLNSFFFFVFFGRLIEKKNVNIWMPKHLKWDHGDSYKLNGREESFP